MEMNQPALYAHIVNALRANADRVANMPALVGLDGFVDEIIRLVDKRISLTEYSTLTTIAALAERLQRAAGHGTNIELKQEKIKLGGNGPIMANALVHFGFPVTYIGNLGWPEIHPLFRPLAEKAQVFSIAEPAHTDALEFDDGKIMLGKLEPLSQITFQRIREVIGPENLRRYWQQSALVALVNWTMIYEMTSIWKSLLSEFAGNDQETERKILFIDLADPEKRLDTDVREALDVLGRFAEYYRVILGCNEKESRELARVLGLPEGAGDLPALEDRAKKLRRRIGIDTVVIHPVHCAVAASANDVCSVEGPFVPSPRISTGGGDHFNAGFCLGAALGFDLQKSLLLGVATSGYYVRTAGAPTIAQLGEFLIAWGKGEI